jgi:hypothetical protein
MNNLEAKAAELIAMAQGVGISAKITHQTENYIYIDYTNTIGSVISHTFTGRVSVKSWENLGGGARRYAISQKNLPFYLKGYKETLESLGEFLEKAGNR